MKKYIQYLPLTAFAAASMLAGSLNANEMAPGGTRTRDQQTRNQRSAHADDHSAARQTHSQAMKGSDLLGMNINTVADDNVGDINEIFIDFQSGEVLAVVVSTGGFLGMGQRQSVISPKDLRFNNDRTEMRTDLSKEQIKTAPRYASGESEGIDRVRPLGKTALMDQDRSGRMDRNQNSQERSTRASMDQDRSGRMDRHENARAQNRRLGLSDLIGMNVENREGESVGSVDEVLIDHENSEVIGVVVSTGGFLGIGGRNTLFGLQEMTLNTEEEKVVLDYNKDQISRFPEYKADDQSVFDDLSDRMGRLNNPSDARNGGNRSSQTVFDQGNSSEEIDMTASIRKDIRDHNQLSRRAKNVTIITNDGKVTLRGEVDSESEKSAVESIAHAKAGQPNVTSQLTVRTR